MPDPAGTFKKPNRHGHLPKPLPQDKVIVKARAEILQFMNHFRQRRSGYRPFLHVAEEKVIIGAVNWAAGSYIWWETNGGWRGKELARARMEWATRAHGVGTWIGQGPVSREQLQAGQRGL